MYEMEDTSEGHPRSSTSSGASAGNAAGTIHLNGQQTKLATGLRPARSSSTLASFVSQSQHSRRARSTRSMATLNPPETKFSSLKYGDKDELGKASILDAQTGVRLQRHKGLWFEDGSVVCRVENNLFCVHMSVLERHSEFFKDMFTIPQPSEGQGQSDSLVIEGSIMRHSPQLIPVITLFDRAEDVANLLNALYDIGPYVFLLISSEYGSDIARQRLWGQRRR